MEQEYGLVEQVDEQEDGEEERDVLEQESEEETLEHDEQEQGDEEEDDQHPGLVPVSLHHPCPASSAAPACQSRT